MQPDPEGVRRTTRQFEKSRLDGLAERGRLPAEAAQVTLDLLYARLRHIDVLIAMIEVEQMMSRNFCSAPPSLIASQPDREG